MSEKLLAGRGSRDENSAKLSSISSWAASRLFDCDKEFFSKFICRTFLKASKEDDSISALCGEQAMRRTCS
jgi:hypothetical protein